MLVQWHARVLRRPSGRWIALGHALADRSNWQSGSRTPALVRRCRSDRMRSTPERRIRHHRRVPVVPQLTAALPAPPRGPWVGHWGPVRAPVFGAGSHL